MRATWATGVGLVVALAGAGCGPRPAPNAVTPNDAVMYVRSNVGDADLYVDGRFVGPLNVLRGGVAVDPGMHRIELRHDNYFSRYLELDLHRAERKRLALELAPVLP